MPILIPVTSAGSRSVRIAAGEEYFTFRAYYAAGQSRHWLLDILDGQERPLVAGVNLVPGVGNLLKGTGEAMDGYQLMAVTDPGTSGTTPESLGRTMQLVLFRPGEFNPFIPMDPMDTVGDDLW